MSTPTIFTKERRIVEITDIPAGVTVEDGFPCSRKHTAPAEAGLYSLVCVVDEDNCFLRYEFVLQNEFITDELKQINTKEDLIRFICEINEFDSVKIGNQILELYRRIGK